MVTRQEKILKKTQNSAKKTAFSSKIPQEIEILKKLPESSHQTGSFGVSQHIGIFLHLKCLPAHCDNDCDDYGWI